MRFKGVSNNTWIKELNANQIMKNPYVFTASLEEWSFPKIWKKNGKKKKSQNVVESSQGKQTFKSTKMKGNWEICLQYFIRDPAYNNEVPHRSSPGVSHLTLGCSASPTRANRRSYVSFSSQHPPKHRLTYVHAHTYTRACTHIPTKEIGTE